MPAPSPSASEMYALSQGSRCEGPERCHYCASPCGRVLQHRDPVLAHLGRPAGDEPRRRPGCPYVCVGCWLWRRKRVSAPFLGGSLKDGTSPARHGWYVTPAEAWAVGTPECSPKLYEWLLKPPQAFFLSLLSGARPPANLLQTAEANHVPEGASADLPLAFTLDNVMHRYTVYELEQAIVHGGQGREPGVRALLGLLGDAPKELVKHVVTDPPDDVKQERGRPVRREETRLTDSKRPMPKKVA